MKKKLYYLIWLMHLGMSILIESPRDIEAKSGDVRIREKTRNQRQKRSDLES